MDFIKKPFVPKVLLLRVTHSIELVKLQNELASEVLKKTKENDRLFLGIVKSLAEAIDAKDTYTNGHSLRVAEYSKEIAKRAGFADDKQDMIYIMGLLHDVGKIGVPDAIINKGNKKITAGIMGAFIFCALIFSACGAADIKNQEVKTSSIFAMDTIMELQVSGDEALLTGAEQEIRSLEAELSVTDENSEISVINTKKEGVVSETTKDILKKAINICGETDGALDISIYPLLKAWGFTTGDYHVPEDEQIDALLKAVDYKRIELTELDDGSARVSVPDDMEIDLGSVAKGYTSDLIAGYFRENGVTSALINLGGNVQCIGAKQNGDDWNVAIKSPFMESKSGIYGVIKAKDKAIITSGGYERYFEQDGKVYWHILDPDTGRPARSGLSSVTIVGDEGILCDGLSTALFVKGLDEAIDFWRSRDDFEAVFITEEGDVLVTEGIADSFSLSSEYYNASLTVISR